MTRLNIRTAEPRDRDRLLRLAEDFHSEDGHVLDAGGRRALEAILAGEPLARAWLFELDGRAVGYGVVTVGFSVEYGGRDGFIDDLYLAPEARGRGLGRQAMAFLEAAARELGINVLHLEAGAENARALALYRRSGFRENGRMLMSKRLVWPCETRNSPNETPLQGERPWPASTTGNPRFSSGCGPMPSSCTRTASRPTR